MSSNEYMREYMLRRYHERRAESYAILGGKCVVCGTTEDLQLDHVDPKTKNFTLSGLWSISRERYLKELQLCQLLCGKHHHEKTAQEQGVPHGGGKSGKKNCYCDLCAPLKRKYNPGEPKGRNGILFHQHGTPSMYWGGCRCDDCRAINTQRMRDYRAKKRGERP